MENLSLLALFAKKSLLVVTFTGVLSIGGLSNFYSTFGTQSENKKIEFRLQGQKTEGCGRAWWNWIFN